ncbi:hypothetical protein HZ326_19898 [Fusarium oxysporum f. sp. albedinis]|nr:hypothetical protein HZ326_19898 [Fusarium oxysporum f. sp. albedinis]
MIDNGKAKGAYSVMHPTIGLQALLLSDRGQRHCDKSENMQVWTDAIGPKYASSYACLSPLGASLLRPEASQAQLSPS